MKNIFKKLSAVLTAALTAVVFVIPCFAAEIGASTGTVDESPATGVQLGNWLIPLICLGVLVIGGIVFAVITIIKKKNGKNDENK